MIFSRFSTVANGQVWAAESSIPMKMRQHVPAITWPTLPSSWPSIRRSDSLLLLQLFFIIVTIIFYYCYNYFVLLLQLFFIIVTIIFYYCYNYFVLLLMLFWELFHKFYHMNTSLKLEWMFVSHDRFIL